MIVTYCLNDAVLWAQRIRDVRERQIKHALYGLYKGTGLPRPVRERMVGKIKCMRKCRKKYSSPTCVVEALTSDVGVCLSDTLARYMSLEQSGLLDYCLRSLRFEYLNNMAWAEWSTKKHPNSPSAWLEVLLGRRLLSFRSSQAVRVRIVRLLRQHAGNTSFTRGGLSETRD